MHLDKELAHEFIWTISLKPKFKRIQYYFEIYSGNEHCYLFEDGIHESNFLDRLNIIKHYFKFAWMNRADICTPPQWVEEVFWYQIFPERFCKLDYKGDKQLTPWDDYKDLTWDSFYGGNLQGALSKLEYLAQFGITGIYFTPLFTATCNHHYNISDYEHINPAFGDNELFKQLVQKAHTLGIKVIIDIYSITQAVLSLLGRMWLNTAKNQSTISGILSIKMILTFTLQLKTAAITPLPLSMKCLSLIPQILRSWITLQQYVKNGS